MASWQKFGKINEVANLKKSQSHDEKGAYAFPNSVDNVDITKFINRLCFNMDGFSVECFLNFYF